LPNTRNTKLSCHSVSNADARLSRHHDKQGEFVTMNINTKKLATTAGNLELVNAFGTGLGLPACTDAGAFIAMLDEKIEAGKAELAKLVGMRDTAAMLTGGRRIRRPWAPGANTIYARVLGILRQRGTLVRPQIADLLAAEAAGGVPLGSISAALWKLAEAGLIEGSRTGWRLAGEDAEAAE
jgi:hypothetical protein